MSTALPLPAPGLGWWTSRRSLILYAAMLMTFFAASSVPTPLYRIYQESWGFSATVLTLIFSAYALSILCALLTVGSLSDHIGRRPVVLAALGLELVSMLLFLLAAGPGWLIAARILQGLATGAATSALSAGLVDADQERGPFINGVAPLLGLAAGALGCSALVDFGPMPIRLVFIVLIVFFVVQLAAMVTAPETTVTRHGALASLRPEISVPRHSRRNLLRATPISVAGWGLGGFYLSLLPSILRSITGSSSALPGGVVVAALAVSGAVSILVARPHSADRIIAVAALMLMVGVTVTLFGISAASVPIMLAGTLLAGVGFGSGFLGALRTTLAAAEPPERAGLMSALYVISYLAFSLPALAAGCIIPFAGLIATAEGFGLSLVLLSVIALFAVRAGRNESA